MIDFSMGWAGPICTRTLADLGADVIKIEAIQYPDWWRGVDRRPAYVLERMYEKSVRYCIMNRNKRGITLDLTRPQGLQLAKRLLADADLVVDNYSVEVLPKLGLGYEVLRQLNPKLVMMSMSAFGTGSIHRDCRAYGSTLEQGSGLPSVVGDANGPPVMSHIAFGDAVGGLNGCAAVLIALIHARLTGKGQFIDLAQIECMMPFAAPWITAHSIDGSAPAKYGNRHPDFVPHGCFPCAGSDNWIVVAVSSDAMWPKLCKLLGRPDWAADEALKSAPARRRIENEIEAAITAWTSTRAPDDAMNALQAAGVASGVARLPIELLADPQLHARGFIQEIDRAFIGRHPQPSMPFRETDRPFEIRSAPPTLGEHNREILAGMLGLSDAEIDQLARDGIIGTEMLMEEQLVTAEEAGGGLMETVHPAERTSEAAATGSPQALMSVRGLGIRFKTAQGIWQATRKIDFDIAPGERVGIVGESGCGKTITGLSILRLLPNNLSGLDGSIMFDGVDLASCSTRTMRGDTRPPDRDDLSGADERARSGVHRRAPDRRDAARPHRRRQGRGAGADHRHAAPRRHRVARAAHRRVSASALRRHAPARHDRGGADLRAAAADRRRADHGARRHRAGADPRSAAEPERNLEDRADADHPRSRRGRRDLHAHDHHVCGRGDRGCRGRRRAGPAAASLYVRPVALAAAFEPAPRQAALDPGPGSLDRRDARRLPLQGALSACDRGLRSRAGTARRRRRPQGPLLALQRSSNCPAPCSTRPRRRSREGWSGNDAPGRRQQGGSHRLGARPRGGLSDHGPPRHREGGRRRLLRRPPRRDVRDHRRIRIGQDHDRPRAGVSAEADRGRHPA